jgi:hypothetical protein
MKKKSFIGSAMVTKRKILNRFISFEILRQDVVNVSDKTAKNLNKCESFTENSEQTTERLRLLWNISPKKLMRAHIHSKELRSFPLPRSRQTTTTKTKEDEKT